MEVFTDARASLLRFSRLRANGSSNGHQPWPLRKKTEALSHADDDGKG
jgi:hypothetical protein